MAWNNALRRLTFKLRGMTAVELVASMVLASVLMVAMLGVLRGLKAHERTITQKSTRLPWQANLDKVLSHDLANSRTYELTPNGLILRGFAGSDVRTGVSTWLPATIYYEVKNDGNRPWLLRRETPQPDVPHLVLTDVTSIQIGIATDENAAFPESGRLQPPTATQVIRETAIPNGLVIEFWGTDGLIYRFQYRAP